MGYTRYHPFHAAFSSWPDTVLGDLDPPAHLVPVITLQRRVCGPHVIDDNFKAEREPASLPKTTQIPGG